LSGTWTEVCCALAQLAAKSTGKKSMAFDILDINSSPVYGWGSASLRYLY
jgi:hypothetical protein